MPTTAEIWAGPENPANYCPGCGLDFSSVSAFDKHRVGRHDPDERRCLDVGEIHDAGMELDPRGRYRINLTEADQERLSALKGSPEKRRRAA
jgi:hypothetical protein